jgi:hypothetical protein
MSDPRPVFVFGSNLSGVHGAGAALHARFYYGAVLGQGVGRWGNSYAIPTKRTPYIPLSLEEIQEHIHQFLLYALNHPDETFLVTPVGCGLAGYTQEEIGPMFRGAPSNCIIPSEFKRYV